MRLKAILSNSLTAVVGQFGVQICTVFGSNFDANAQDTTIIVNPEKPDKPSKPERPAKPPVNRPQGNIGRPKSTRRR